MSPILNPYVAGNPVGISQTFVDREDVIREILRLLDDENRNIIVLHGQRRIGKTSILQFLEAYLPEEGDYWSILFDLQSVIDAQLDQLIHSLAMKIALVTGYSKPDFESDFQEIFCQSWLPELLEKSQTYKLILLFDEFDTLTESSKVSELFPYLKHLASIFPRNLKLVFAVGRNIGDLNQLALSFFKDIKTKQVTLLSKEYATRLIKTSQNGDIASLLWDNASINRVWDLTHGHPYLTQALCWRIWERSYDEEPDYAPHVRIEDVDDAVDETLAESEGALEWLWNGLGVAERIVTAALAQAGSTSISQNQLNDILQESGLRILKRELLDAPQLLQKWDLIEPDGDGYRFRVELLRRWIEKHHPLSRVQNELDYIKPAAENFFQAANSLYMDVTRDTNKSFSSNSDDSRMERVIDWLKEALRINPDHQKANELLAEIYIQKNQLSEARQLLEPLVDILPMVTKQRLAQVYLLQARVTEDEKEKLKLYDESLKLNSSYKDAILERHDVYLKKGKVAQANGDLEEAAKAYKDAGEQELYQEIVDLINIQRKIKQNYIEGRNALQHKNYSLAKDQLKYVVGQQVDYEQNGIYAIHLLERAIWPNSLKTGLGIWVQRSLISFFAIGLISMLIGVIIGLVSSSVVLSNFPGSGEALKTEYAFNPIIQDTPLEVKQSTLIPSPSVKIFTNTPYPSETVQPTETEVPLTPTPIPQLNLKNISVDNLEKIAKWNTWRYDQEISDMHFTPDGHFLATIIGGKIQFRVINDGSFAYEIGEEGFVYSKFAIDKYGDILAAGTVDGSIWLWDLRARGWISHWKAHDGKITDMEFSPSQKDLLITGSQDKKVKYWNISDQSLLHEWDTATDMQSVAFSMNGTQVAAGFFDGRINIWSTLDYTLIKSFQGRQYLVSGLAFSQTGYHLVSGFADSNMILWTLSDGSQSSPFGGFGGNILCLAMSMDNSYIAVGTTDGLVRLWDYENGKLLLAIPDSYRSVSSDAVINGPVTAIEFSRDGKLLAFASSFRTIQFWSIKD